MKKLSNSPSPRSAVYSARTDLPFNMHYQGQQPYYSYGNSPPTSMLPEVLEEYENDDEIVPGFSPQEMASILNTVVAQGKVPFKDVIPPRGPAVFSGSANYPTPSLSQLYAANFPYNLPPKAARPRPLAPYTPPSLPGGAPASTSTLTNLYRGFPHNILAPLAPYTSPSLPGGAPASTSTLRGFPHNILAPFASNAYMSRYDRPSK